MQRIIGSTNIAVFPIGLGAMPLSIQGRPDKEHAEAVIVAAVEAGVEFIDTANCYCIDNTDFGHNERLISTAMRNLLNGAQITIATKGGLTRPGGGVGKPMAGRRVFVGPVNKACATLMRIPSYFTSTTHRTPQYRLLTQSGS